MRQNSYKIEQFVPPYSKLACIYDEVMAHVNYFRWAQYVHELIQKFRPDSRRVLDASCGTGTFLMHLSSRMDYELAGFDYSLTMVKQAQEKIRQKSLHIPVWQGDIRQFAVSRPADVVVCLYDSINYIMTLDGIVEAINTVYDALHDDGLFIFDICTERNSIKYFDNYIDREHGANYSYIRKSSYDRTGRIHRNVFHIEFDTSDYIYVEQHEQRIYYLHEIYDIVGSGKFQLLATLDGFSLRRASERSLRAHFVMQKVA